jgi:DNA-binding response OmpR family regulator
MNEITLHKLELRGPLCTIKLSQSEAQMLKAFVHAQGAQLNFDSMAKILNLGVDESLDKASLQVRMVRLRKKMHACGAQGSVIESIRNVGYQLFEPVKIIS